MNELDQRGQDIVSYLDSIADDEEDLVEFAEVEFGMDEQFRDQLGSDTFGSDEFALLLNHLRQNDPEHYEEITKGYYDEERAAIEEFLEQRLETAKKSQPSGEEKQAEVTNLMPLDNGYEWKLAPPGWVVEQMCQLYKTPLFLEFAVFETFGFLFWKLVGALF